MSLKIIAAAVLPLMAILADPAVAGRRGEHEAAYSAARSGDILSFGEIRHRVMPRMGGAILTGSDYDETAAVYTLNLRRGVSVFRVFVDARTGAIIGREGD